ncbi:TetR family transcriptional regulator [Kutzneria sp. CA-103260]|nr:TetR family transcriptional regulator [Kutzneria sp. CA-103260]
MHDAVRGLLAEGRDPVTVREVSERSGVSEVTIYRRWGTVESLMLDVAITQLTEEAPFPDTGDLRRDLLDWVSGVAASVKSPEGFALYRALAAATSPLGGNHSDQARADAAMYLRRRTDQMQAVFDRAAAAAGTTPPSVARVFDLVLAPVYLRAIFGYDAPDADLAELVDRALGDG